MWLTKLFAAVMAILAGLVPSSCSTSKHPTAQQHAPSIIIATSSDSLTNKNLGELQMTNHYEFYVNLGAGKSCIIKPTLLNRNNLQLMVALESKNAKGIVKGLSVVKVISKSGEPFDVAVGDMNLTLTPILAAE
jgi:hypothetical protein